MRIYPKNQSRQRNLVNYQKAKGFSLFELVVFIILVAIIYATAANRFAEFPGLAERANFLAITTQLQTAITLQVMSGIARGRVRSAEGLDGVNPMELMLESPSNYIGAFDLIDKARVGRRIWYFDRRTRELVYLVNDTSGVYLVRNQRDIPTDEIRFRIMLDYGEQDIVSGLPVGIVEIDGIEIAPENRRRRLLGVVLRPVFPFKWREPDADLLVAEATGEISS